MIEDIILSNDKKGVSKLRKYLPHNFCERAAKYIMQNSERTIIVTGFYVNGSCETDGLPGAISLAETLRCMGSQITFITDQYCGRILRQLQESEVIEVPITELDQKYIGGLIKRIRPTLAISIERCGRSKDNKYYNFKERNITQFTAKLDLLVERAPRSVAIGDTGNEIGMGDLYGEIKKEGLFSKPSLTRADHLVISSISNWGCYGIIAYLSKFTKKRHLDCIKDEEILLRLNELGMVDGITGKQGKTVDGYRVEETKRVLKELEDYYNK
jgi:hypothetical protein